MQIKQNGSQASSIGPVENFTGHARRDPIYVAAIPSRLAVGAVTFDPARVRSGTRILSANF